MPRILIGNIKGPQGAQGIQGPQGPVGPQGPQGPMPELINNALATQAGVAALDAAMGKFLQDQINKQNSNSSGKFVENIHWSKPLTIGVSSTGDELVIMQSGEWVGTIKFTSKP